MSNLITRETIQKFDVPGPRYTSYPTAPVWSQSVRYGEYCEKLRSFAKTDKTLSLYVHLPFCVSMCTFCACNVLIRKSDPKYVDEYLTYLFKEIDLVVEQLGKKRKVLQFHWGGGTPNFLNEDQIERLFKKLSENFDIDFDGEVAIELDPRTITLSKVKKIKELGFNRVSMGVQDFSDDVQQAVNRIQPFESVKTFYNWCRDLKFSSVNFDLIYGLPKQTPDSFRETIDKVVELKPDRIALYSFAYVPWIKKHQNKIDTADLPKQNEKMDIFLYARQKLIDGGYVAIAMDHFALKKDALAKAFDAGTLYRNFMGYTVKPADDYLGFGLTSIGYLENTFIQNEKVLGKYYEALTNGVLPVERGKELDRDDRIRQWTIKSLMCQFKVDKKIFRSEFQADFDEYFSREIAQLMDSEADGLVVIHPDSIEVTDMGKIFVRNVCMVFDKYFNAENPAMKFSRTV